MAEEMRKSGQEAPEMPSGILSRETDPLYCALKEGDLETARTMLEQRERLNYAEAFYYAPLALGRPVWLLEKILDLAPRVEMCCAKVFERPGDGWKIKLHGSLLMAAAALDDLEAVELLLARGYKGGNHRWVEREKWRVIAEALCPEEEEKGFEDVSAHVRDYGPLGSLWMEPPGYETTEQRPKPYLYEPTMDNDPLSAAIWCGAVRCTARLLPERAESFSLADLRALSREALPGDEARHQAVVGAVEQKYGCELVDILFPGAFADWNAPLFLSCVRRHLDWLNENQAEHIVQALGKEEEGEADWAWNLLPLVPQPLLNKAIVRRMRSRGYTTDQRGVQRVLRHPEVHVTVDCCAVPPDIENWALMEILEHTGVGGEPPEEGLSGLAVCLLERMLTANSCRSQIIRSNKAIFTLKAENPEMVKRYLYQKVERKQVYFRDVLMVMNLIGLKEVHDYEL